jgi:hypothetical protein
MWLLPVRVVNRTARWSSLPCGRKRDYGADLTVLRAADGAQRSWSDRYWHRSATGDSRGGSNPLEVGLIVSQGSGVIHPLASAGSLRNFALLRMRYGLLRCQRLSGEGAEESRGWRVFSGIVDSVEGRFYSEKHNASSRLPMIHDSHIQGHTSGGALGVDSYMGEVAVPDPTDWGEDTIVAISTANGAGQLVSCGSVARLDRSCGDCFPACSR